MSVGGAGPDPGWPGPGPQGGWPPPPPPYPQPGMYGYPVPARRTNGLAIAALCCGVGVFVAGPLAGIAAIILGAISLRQIRETGEDGHAMAMTGLVLGVVGVVLTVLAVLLFISVASVISHQ